MSRPVSVAAVDLGLPTGRETILHVDMDAFYASVCQRDNPSLRGRPVIVGGAGDRGVVAAASYEARRFGVHSAMPTARARRLCPDGVFVAGDIAAYSVESKAIREILESFTPLVEPLSLDEAYLDVAGARRLFGDPDVIADAIRRRIRDLRELPASVGVASCKFLAKLASRSAKPDGVFVIPAGAEQSYLHRLPIADVSGVGESTRRALDRIAVETVGDLARLPLSNLERAVGKAAAHNLARIAGCRFDDPVVVGHAAKSIGHERTFERDVVDDVTISAEILRLSDRVARRLRRSGLAARTVTLRYRLAGFTTYSAGKTLDAPTAATVEVFGAASASRQRLLDDKPIAGSPVRLIGVSASNLVAAEMATRQLRLSIEPQWDKLDAAADAVRRRFGSAALTSATLVGSDAPSSVWGVHR